ncbi:MAG: poly-gamma-glutamate biosynthesis protein PgsC [Ignavibacteriales bacterium]|nr:poly-gamma-glutamate biosynthesis protein PgsC [Ignavibacteriales bacterium]
MIVEIFLAGLIIGFLYYEITGYTAGGVIAPAYFALYLHSPLRIISTIIAALVVWIVIEQLSRVLLVFGRRRLMLSIIAGFCIKLIYEKVTGQMNLTYQDISVVGFIIPGLIANEMCRQKPLPTLASIAVVTVLITLVTMLLH